jgi:hypothetical protein
LNKTNALPDDADDTVMVLMASDTDDSTAADVHELMQMYANTSSGRKSKSSYKKYKNLPVYSTWFGKNWPIDIDVCVLSNVLTFVQKYHLPFSRQDSASIHVLSDVMAHRYYMTAPSYISPHYARTPVILYHLARVMQQGKIPGLDVYKQQLIADAQTEYRQTNNFLDKILLSSALYKLGTTPTDSSAYSDSGFRGSVEGNNFSFFIANVSAVLPNPLRMWMTGTKLGTFYYYCPAYNDAVLLENLLLARTQSQYASK